MFNCLFFLNRIVISVREFKVTNAHAGKTYRNILSLTVNYNFRSIMEKNSTYSKQNPHPVVPMLFVPEFA